MDGGEKIGAEGAEEKTQGKAERGRAAAGAWGFHIWGWGKERAGKNEARRGAKGSRSAQWG